MLITERGKMLLKLAFIFLSSKTSTFCIFLVTKNIYLDKNIAIFASSHYFFIQVGQYQFRAKSKKRKKTRCGKRIMRPLVLKKYAPHIFLSKEAFKTLCLWNKNTGMCVLNELYQKLVAYPLAHHM